MDMIRKTEFSIDPVFTQRWSPRAFDGRDMAKEDLLTMIEAARWAPSAYNIQPWRFIYIQRNDPRWEEYVRVLDPFNASWAKDASAMVFLASDQLVDREEAGEPVKSNYHSFDAGSAWANLALQATKMGYSAHAMAGVLFEPARELLDLPDRYKLEIAIAIGMRGDGASLSDDLRQRETPSPRKPLSEIAYEGRFDHA